MGSGSSAVLFGAWLTGFLIAIGIFVFANMADDINRTKQLAEEIAKTTVDLATSQTA